MKALTAILTPAFELPSLSIVALTHRARKAVDIARERRALADLDPKMLRDIGVSEADVSAETRRGFWDIPAGR